MRYTIVTAPTFEAVTVEEVKSSPVLRVTASEDDAVIERYIQSAREAFEDGYRIMLESTVDVWFDHFPRSDRIELPHPLVSVTSLKYYDQNNVLQTAPATLYDLDLVSEPARLYLAYGQYWPMTWPKANAVVIRVVAGWHNMEAIPASVKDGIHLWVQQQYDGEDRMEAIANLWRNYRRIPV